MILISTLMALVAAISTTANTPQVAKAQDYPAGGTTVHETRLAVYRAGKQYLGTPYRSQGLANGYGLDCSELTLLAYRQGAGIRLYDSPESQMTRGRWVRDARKGDLLFWSEDGSGVPTHVGLARGDGLMTLHASSYYGKTVVSDGSYIRGYIGAKRLIF